MHEKNNEKNSGSKEKYTCFDFALSDSPRKMSSLHSLTFRDYLQRIVESKIEVLVCLPGIDTSSLKVRNNPNVLLVSARFRDDMKSLFHCDCPIDLQIKLLEKVDPMKTVVEYRDGLLKIEFALSKQ